MPQYGPRNNGTRGTGMRCLITDDPSGTNQNTNGRIREYPPKGAEITSGREYLRAVADSLNDRPRAILGFRKLYEVFAELLLQES